MLRAKLTQKHCSEEQLLAFLDGELRPDRRRKVQEHLARCWPCRGKMGDLERRAHQIAALLTDTTLLGADKIGVARNRFLVATRQPHAPSPTVSFQFGLLSAGVMPRSFGVPWSASVLVVAGFLIWGLSSRRVPDPLNTLSRAVRMETASIGQPVHQKFRLEFAEYKPQRIERASHLEVWADSAGQRFASTWKTGQGELRYAVWQPDAKTRYRFDEKRHRGVPVTQTPTGPAEPLSSVAGGSSLATLESRFKTWISVRQWRPLSLANDFSLFVTQEGALLRAEKSRCSSGTCVVITATSAQGGGGTVTMRLEVDAETQRTHAQEIRFDSPGSSIGLKVVAEQFEVLDGTHMQAVLFNPDVPIAKPITERTAEPVAIPGVESSAPMPIQPVVTETEIANTQVKIEYELHRLRACAGELVRVSVDPAKGIGMTAVLEDSGHKEELLKALRPLALPAWVSINFQTLDEAVAKQSAGPAKESPAVGKGVPVASISRKSLPLDAYLSNYFKTHPVPSQVSAMTREGKVPDNPEDQTAAYSSLLVSLSQQSYRESWAIRRLAEKFGNTRNLSEESIWLLEAMLRDHARELQGIIIRIRELLQDGLEPAALSALPAIQRTHVEAPGDGEWPKTALAIFRQADGVNAALFNLFAYGTQPSQDSGVPDPGRAIADLLSRFPDLEKNIRQGESLDLRLGSAQASQLSH